MLTLVDILQRLGQRIKDLRTQRGWSQEAFADVCRVHRTYMGHLERGEKNVCIKSLVRVSDALEISVSELLRDVSGDEGNDAATTHSAADQIDRERLMREVIRLERTVSAVKQIVAPEQNAVAGKAKRKS